MPSAIKVNMLRWRDFSDAQPRSKNGRAHHNTTGLASRNSSHTAICGGT